MKTRLASEVLTESRAHKSFRVFIFFKNHCLFSSVFLSIIGALAVVYRMMNIKRRPSQSPRPKASEWNESQQDPEDVARVPGTAQSSPGYPPLPRRQLGNALTSSAGEVSGMFRAGPLPRGQDGFKVDHIYPIISHV